MIKALSMALALALTPLAAVATPLGGQETYDLLFRNGTLEGMTGPDILIYDRAVANSLNPDAADRDSGEIALSVEQGDASSRALLELRQGDKHRKLGQFPASVGNPMIMYFYETSVRDMAESTGGSPYYIRNRVKNALVQPSDVEEGTAEYKGQTIDTRTVRLYPFKDDPNVARMQGFGDLELEVTMSDDVPGWYLSLTATAGEVYSSHVRLAGAAE